MLLFANMPLLIILLLEIFKTKNLIVNDKPTEQFNFHPSDFPPSVMVVVGAKTILVNNFVG